MAKNKLIKGYYMRTNIIKEYMNFKIKITQKRNKYNWHMDCQGLTSLTF